MKSFWKFGAVSVLAGSAFLVGAVEIGDAAPEVEVAAWLREGETLEIRPGETYLLGFMSGDDRLDRMTLAMLAGCQKKLADRGLQSAVFFSGDELPPADGPLLRNAHYPVGLTPKFQSVAGFLPSGEVLLPLLVIVNREGKVVWRGDLDEMRRVLIPILDGTFDYRAAEARLKLFLAIGEQMQQEDYEAALKLIEDGLAANPDDEQLVAFECYIYVTYLKEVAKAMETVNAALQQYPENYDFYLLKLKLLEQQPDLAEADETYQAMIEHLGREPARLLELAEALLAQETGPIRIAPALGAARKAYQEREQLTITERIRAITALAQCCQRIGRLSEAVRLQEEALELAKGAAEEPLIVEQLEFYRAAEALGRDFSLDE
ncbi:lipopolysaccharide assembly protein LapB [Victivallis sp. Marseille-Q1083]|uniref:tetratricopeptide repeat protein n=1 Tax=Victivallis sp. Marseille-Q1083 TaxID=2717288 RepID=UPI00158F1E0A|nr:hypothetical protein [Victivallis sp. Marseille-Q1083]